MTSANNLAKRNRFFRNRAGAIPWTKRDKSSAKIQEYIDSVHARQRPGRRGNDTRGCQDLTREQIQELFEINAGSRSRIPAAAGAENRGSKLSDPKSLGVMPSDRKAAVAKSSAPQRPVTPPPKRRTKRKYVSSEEGSPPALHRGPSSLITANLPSIGGVLGIPERPRSGIPFDTSPGEPSSRLSNDQDDVRNKEAETESDSEEDYNDRLYEFPETPAEMESIQRLLQPTLAHYYDLTGFHIQEWNLNATYVEQIEEIERAMYGVMERLGRSRPDILRIEEFNEERAVWNLPWDSATYGEPPDLSGEVLEQLDGSGRLWQGGRWV